MWRGSNEPSFRRKPESSSWHLAVKSWIPAFAGMTTNEISLHDTSRSQAHFYRPGVLVGGSSAIALVAGVWFVGRALGLGLGYMWRGSNDQ
jgi:hypothetical protein